MSSDLALRIEGLGKDYTIRHAPRSASMAEELTRSVRRRLGRPAPDDGTVETFSALRDVTFDVARGDVVGIIGRNGAGKSTLLKILSRITEPSRGEVQVFGRIGALLEVGAGFHPELTGRENVFLNGAILGLSRRELARLFDEIVDFAEVEKFIDTPVKRYSSGMYVRLAFAVAAFVLPEILIVDEVLAVGDTAFQKKCLGKMSDAASEGRTVLFVSHNMQVVNKLCTAGVLLQAGRATQVGTAAEIVRAYQDAHAQSGNVVQRFTPRYQDLGLLEVSVEQDAADGALLSSRPTRVSMRVQLSGMTTPELACGFRLVDEYGQKVLSSFWNDLDEFGSVDGEFNGEYVFTCTVPAHYLNEGTHRLAFTLAIHKVRGATEDEQHYLDFEIFNTDGVGSHFGLGRDWRPEPLLPALLWSLPVRAAAASDCVERVG